MQVDVSHQFFGRKTSNLLIFILIQFTRHWGPEVAFYLLSFHHCEAATYPSLPLNRS